MKTGRFRHFDVVLYCSQKELFKLLHTYAERISHYAFAYHDKDIYEEDGYEEDGKTLKHKKGDIKVPHFHLVISFYNACSCSAVKKLFTTEEDKPRVDVANDISALFRYLVHLDNPEKHQYNYDDIITDDLVYYESLEKSGQRKDADQNAIEIVNLIRKHVNPWIIAKKYGRDAIIHYKQYEEFAKSIDLWEFTHIEERGKPPKLIQIENENLEIPFE